MTGDGKADMIVTLESITGSVVDLTISGTSRFASVGTSSLLSLPIFIGILIAALILVIVYIIRRSRAKQREIFNQMHQDYMTSQLGKPITDKDLGSNSLP